MTRIAAARTIFLITALLSVVGSMKWLSSAAGRRVFAEIGLGSPSTDLTHMDIDLCPSRVRSVAWADGARLEEGGGLRAEWRMTSASKPLPYLVPYLAVERWLSLYCRPDATPSASVDLKPFATLEYVDGTKFPLEKNASTGFRWQGRTFESASLSKAFEELRSLDKTGGAP